MSHPATWDTTFHLNVLTVNSVAFSPQKNDTDRETSPAGEASADFCGQRVLRGQCNGSLRSLISVLYTGTATNSCK
jgi:hypothetical protein